MLNVCGFTKHNVVHFEKNRARSRRFPIFNDKVYSENQCKLGHSDTQLIFSLLACIFYIYIFSLSFLVCRNRLSQN